MNAYKTLSAGIAAATIVGAVGFAYAQTNDTTAPSRPGSMPADSTQTAPAAMPAYPAVTPADATTSTTQRSGDLPPANSNMQRRADTVSPATMPPAGMTPSPTPSDSMATAPVERTPKADRN